MFFTKTEVAQRIVQIGVAAVAADQIATVITDNTDHTKDDLVVKVPSAVGGYVISAQVCRITDPIVSRIARKLQSLKHTEEAPAPAVA